MYMKLIINPEQFEKLKGSIVHNGPKPKKDPTAKFIKCTGCRKFFTQTFHKKKKSLPICPWCLKHNTEHGELKEIETFDYEMLSGNETKKQKKSQYKEVLNDPDAMLYHTIKTPESELNIYGKVNDENAIVFNVIDATNKIKVGGVEFDMNQNGSFEASVPYVLKEYRNRGIATEMYKLALKFGDIVSGGIQSNNAILLWKKLFKELPNPMVFIKGGN